MRLTDICEAEEGMRVVMEGLDKVQCRKMTGDAIIECAQLRVSFDSLIRREGSVDVIPFLDNTPFMRDSGSAV